MGRLTKSAADTRDAWEHQSALAIEEIECGEELAGFGATTVAMFDRCAADGRFTQREQRFIRERLALQNGMAERNLALDNKDLGHSQGQLSLLAQRRHEARGADLVGA